MARMIVAEACPACGSLEIRAVEPRWFAVDLDRRAELDRAELDSAELDSAASDGGWVERLEFACRDYGLHWD